MVSEVCQLFDTYVTYILFKSPLESRLFRSLKVHLFFGIITLFISPVKTILKSGKSYLLRKTLSYDSLPRVSFEVPVKEECTV